MSVYHYSQEVFERHGMERSSEMIQFFNDMKVRIVAVNEVKMASFTGLIVKSRS